MKVISGDKQSTKMPSIDYYSSTVKDTLDLRKEYLDAWDTKYSALWEELLLDYEMKYRTNNIGRAKEGQGHFSKVFMPLTRSYVTIGLAKKINSLFSGNSFPIRYEITDKKKADKEKTQRFLDEVKRLVQEELSKSRFDMKCAKTMLQQEVLGNGVMKAPVNITVSEPDREIKKDKDGNFKKFSHKYKDVEVTSVEYINMLDYITDVDVDRPENAIAEFHEMPEVLPIDFKRMSKEFNWHKESVEYILKNISEEPTFKNGMQNLKKKTSISQKEKSKRVFLTECWRYILVETLKQDEKYLSDELKEAIKGKDDYDQIAVMCHIAIPEETEGVMLGITLNKTGRRPFLSCPCQLPINGPMGSGNAEINRGSQSTLNSLLRLLIDGTYIASTPSYVMNADKLHWYEDMDLEMWPGKTFFAKDDAKANEIIYPVSHNFQGQTLMQDADAFIRLGDRVTSTSKSDIGEAQGSRFPAQGTAMLLRQTNLVKALEMKNLDNYLLEPIAEIFYSIIIEKHGERLYKEYGSLLDMPIQARGLAVESYIKDAEDKESLIQFLNLVNNFPDGATLVNHMKILRKIGMLSNLGDILNTPEETAIAQEQLKQFQIEMEQAKRLANFKMYKDQKWLDVHSALTPLEQIQHIEQELNIKPDPARIAAVAEAAQKNIRKESEKNRGLPPNEVFTPYLDAFINQQLGGING
jgi:hypothetical protein